MNNKYVDFVSDEDFLECVKWVCESYPKDSEEIDMESLHRNTIDPFKLVFDVTKSELPVKNWIKTEQLRQQDKTINNRIGEFHQKFLGKVKGWLDLGVGDETKVDLKKEDDLIFIELKNKFNTMNSDATDKCRDKLEEAIKKNPKAKAYWGYIVSKKGDSGDTIWEKSGRENNENIRKIWGTKVYELVTGDPNALEKVWNVLAEVIKDLTKSKYDLDKEDEYKLKEFFKLAFSQNY
jgi:hypothetical protein